MQSTQQQIIEILMTIDNIQHKNIIKQKKSFQDAPNKTIVSNLHHMKVKNRCHQPNVIRNIVRNISCVRC